MKICWQNVHYPDITLGGGGARNSRHITAAMRAAGHNVVFLSETRKPADVGARTVFGAPVHYYLRPQIPERLWLVRSLVNPIGYRRSLAPYVGEAEAYFCNDPEIVFALKRLSEGKPVIARVEGTRAGDRASWNSADGLSVKDRVYRHLLARIDDGVSIAGWRRCDALVVKSKMIHDELVNWYGIPSSKIAIIPNGVDFQHFAGDRATPEVISEVSSGPCDMVRIVFVGRLSRVKNLEFLLQAFSKANLRESAQLVIVGDGSERERLQALARACGIANRVSFLGHRDEVAPYLAACHIFAMPSLYETIANCLLEAMAAGLACVALRPGGAVRTSSDEIIEDGRNGLLCDSGSTDDMSRRLDQLIHDAELRRRLGDAAQQLIYARFSWESCAERYVNLAQRLICSRAT